VKFYHKFGLYYTVRFYDNSILFQAIKIGNTKLISYALNRKLGINYISPVCDISVLKISINKKMDDVALKLIELGCPINVVTKTESSHALTTAIRNGRYKIVDKLLEFGCNINFTKPNGDTCLNACASKKMLSYVYEKGCTKFNYKNMRDEFKLILLEKNKTMVLENFISSFEQNSEIVNKLQVPSV
jgi:ankyrin repeat protein